MQCKFKQGSDSSDNSDSSMLEKRAAARQRSLDSSDSSILEGGEPVVAGAAVTRHRSLGVCLCPRCTPLTTHFSNPQCTT